MYPPKKLGSYSFTIKIKCLFKDFKTFHEVEECVYKPKNKFGNVMLSIFFCISQNL